MPFPKKALGHFLGWLIVPLIAFFYFKDLFYWYSVIGSLLILIIYYYAYFGKGKFFPAIAGWFIAFIISYLCWV